MNKYMIRKASQWLFNYMLNENSEKAKEKGEEDKWIYPNDNQIGLLLMNYILKFKKNIPKNGVQ